jgi:hypothetical protein
MRVAEPIHLKEDVRRKLEQQARGRSTAARVVAFATEKHESASSRHLVKFAHCLILNIR